MSLFGAIFGKKKPSPNGNLFSKERIASISEREAGLKSPKMQMAYVRGPGGILRPVGMVKSSSHSFKGNSLFGGPAKKKSFIRSGLIEKEGRRSDLSRAGSTLISAAKITKSAVSNGFKMGREAKSGFEQYQASQKLKARLDAFKSRKYEAQMREAGLKP